MDKDSCIWTVYVINDPSCLPLCLSPSHRSTHHNTDLLDDAAVVASAAVVVHLVLPSLLLAWAVTLPDPAAGRDVTPTASARLQGTRPWRRWRRTRACSFSLMRTSLCRGIESQMNYRCPRRCRRLERRRGAGLVAVWAVAGGSLWSPPLARTRPSPVSVLVGEVWYRVRM